MTTMNDCWPGPDETVLCAVSGGLDSMCLLHMLTERCGADHVIAAHFNHQLRGEAADRDEDFVREYCVGHGIAFVSDRGDVRKLAKDEGLSLEEAARKLRYVFLRKEATARGGVSIYTAHHADDNAETILLNLVRGTGITGLAGMRCEQNGICRPLLGMTRAELETYAAARHIPYVEDATNADPDAAARNLVRLQVMPLLRELNPRAVENMNRAAELLAEDDAALTRSAETLLARGGREPGREAWLPVKDCDGQSKAVISRCLWELMAAVAGHKKDLTHAHVEAVMALLWALPGREVSLPYDMVARRDTGSIRVCRRDIPEQVTLEPNCPTRWGGCILTLLDHREGEGLAIRGDGAVTVAPCYPGGRLTLPGAKGARSVKRLCVDRHISLAERDCLPAVYLNGRLAGVWKLGVDMEFLPVGNACRFIQITKHTEEKTYEK